MKPPCTCHTKAAKSTKPSTLAAKAGMFPINKKKPVAKPAAKPMPY